MKWAFSAADAVSDDRIASAFAASSNAHRVRLTSVLREVMALVWESRVLWRQRRNVKVQLLRRFPRVCLVRSDVVARGCGGREIQVMCLFVCVTPMMQ